MNRFKNQCYQRLTGQKKKRKKKFRQKKRNAFAFAETNGKKINKNQQKKSSPVLFPSAESNPSLELVKEYFRFQKNTEFEAERFFNYYSSNGWLIGGKTKMEDWKASARNWMLNTSKFAVNIPKNQSRQRNDRAQNLHANNDKNYSEPL